MHVEQANDKEEIKCGNMIKNTKMTTFDDVIKQSKKKKKNNSNWSELPDHSNRISIIRGLGSRKTNSLFNLISF